MQGAGMAKSPEAVSDLDIQEWLQRTYGFVPHPYWIAHCREIYLHTPAASSESRPEWHECPQDKILPIREALQHFGLLK